MSGDLFILCVLALLAVWAFLDKIGNARETEAEARQTEAEARLLEAQNEAERRAPFPSAEDR